MTKIIALVLAAGKGTRMGATVPKQFLNILEEPMVIRSVKAFLTFSHKVIVVTGEEDLETVRNLLSEFVPEESAEISVVAGGKERYESSYNGLCAVKAWLSENGMSDGMVLIHDAARCLVSEAVIRGCIDGCLTHGSAVAAVPVKDTIKVAEEGVVKDTPARNTLFAVQTPQTFFLSDIMAAYEKAKASGTVSRVTDDAMVMETYSDKTVYLSAGSDENIKVTTQTDIRIAEEILRNRVEK